MYNSARLPLTALLAAVVLGFLVVVSYLTSTLPPGEGGLLLRGRGAPGSQQDLAARGEQLFGQLSCTNCHNLNGQPGAGPALNGIFGTPVQLEDGQTMVRDEAYLRESILQPDAKIVAGYPRGGMSAGIAGIRNRLQQGDTTQALVDYIRSLK